MANAQQALRNVRIIHFGFLTAPALLFFVLSTVRITEKAEPSFLPKVLALLSFSEVGIATLFRSKMIRPALGKLQASPQDSAALAQWTSGNILSFAFALSVVLYGVLIRVMGFSWNIAAWFFVAGFLLLVLWAPRLQLPLSTNLPGPPAP
jgi:hypothetical protein